MATQSYKGLQREARAAASAQRKAEKAEWLRQLILIAETKRLALMAAKEAIRASGRKVTDYSLRELHQAAEARINPALIERAKARIAQ
jgi:hypothetical protein